MRTLIPILAVAALAGCGSIETDPADFPATVVTVPARTVVAMRIESLDEPGIDRFADEVEKQGITPAGDLMARGADLLVPVADGTEAEPPLAITDMNAMRVAAVECQADSLEAVERQVDRLYDWIAASGYRPVEPPIRVLLAYPPAQWRVEILIPVATAR
ncbi:MAG: GyrI-like domain-containing protein [Planctomycetota bacterium]